MVRSPHRGPRRLASASGAEARIPARSPLDQRLRVVALGCVAMLTSPLFACESEFEGTPSWVVSLQTGEEEGAWLSAWGPAVPTQTAHSSEAGETIEPLDIWIVGGQPGAGSIRNYHGGEWVPEALPAGTPLVNWIHGTDDGAFVVAVGRSGTILHRQVVPGQGTPTWVAVASPVTTDLWGSFVLSDTDAWAVGDAPEALPGETPQATLLHWDGNTWTTVPMPTLDRDVDALFKVWASSASDVFAVGRAGVILHFDGSDWVQQGSGTGSDLISLWGTGPGEILAVGGRNNGVLARYDGNVWTSETLPAVAGLNGVWMDEHGDATIVGIQGALLSVPAGSLTPMQPQEAVPQSNAVLHATFGRHEGARVAVGGSLDRNPPWTGVVLQTQLLPP